MEMENFGVAGSEEPKVPMARKPGKISDMEIRDSSS